LAWAASCGAWGRASTKTSTGPPNEFSSRRRLKARKIKRSVTDDYIICLEDGKKLKMLKRHLMTAYNMTPEQYRGEVGPET
jgi:predicted transcriptional regulator